MDRTISESLPGPLCGQSEEHPLGPRVVRLRMGKTKARAVAAGLVLASLSIFAVAARLSPPAAGYGAHEQLGLGPCSFPLLFGLPCPTCGMTTSFAHFVRGHMLASFHTQPAGFLTAASVATALIIGVIGLIRGRMWGINWYRVPPARAVAFAAGILIGGWGYKLATTLLASL